MSHPNIALSIKDLSVVYGDKPVLWDIDLDIYQGDFMAIIGPNGAGKTSLLNAILGLVNVAAGKVECFQKPIKQMLKSIAYVPQKNTVDWDFPLNVMDVVLMGTYGKLGWFKRPGKEEYSQALAALKKVDMLPFKHRHISQLSGGQQQRVFLARALVQNPRIFLLDEPFIGIDAVTEHLILQCLKECKNQGKTILLVHHDLQTVAKYFDSAFLLNVRQIAYGAVSEVLNDKNLALTYGPRSSYIQNHQNYDSY